MSLVSACLYCQPLWPRSLGKQDALARAVRELAAHGRMLCLDLG